LYYPASKLTSSSSLLTHPPLGALSVQLCHSTSIRGNPGKTYRSFCCKVQPMDVSSGEKSKFTIFTFTLCFVLISEHVQ